MTVPADWANTRQKVLAAQNNRCALQDCPHIGSLDVIKLHGQWVGFCRRHRLRVDAAERCHKAARTRGKWAKQGSWL